LAARITAQISFILPILDAVEYDYSVICRRVMLVFLASLLSCAPLLACVPNPSMTAAEMDCCKKMAGHCDMGGGNHKCCDTTVNHAAPSKAIVRHANSHLPALSALPVRQTNHVFAAWRAESVVSYPVAPSPSPPGFPSVLRI
jgi:hypothetical protein